MEEFSRIQRLPPYVFAVVGDLKMKLRRQNIDIVDFSMGNPDIPTPPHIVDKLVEAAQKPVNHRYSLSRGIPHLRDAVCERYKRLYDVDLDPNTEAIVTVSAPMACSSGEGCAWSSFCKSASRRSKARMARWVSPLVKLAKKPTRLAG